MTSVLDAAYHTVHDYPGGAPALAARLGKRPAVLCHEVAPGPSNASAKFGLMDAMRIMAMTGDHRVLSRPAARWVTSLCQHPNTIKPVTMPWTLRPP